MPDACKLKMSGTTCPNDKESPRDFVSREQRLAEDKGTSFLENRCRTDEGCDSDDGKACKRTLDSIGTKL